MQKEKYEKHRNVLVSFFAFAMLVVLNSQKLSLRMNGIFRVAFVLRSMKQPLLVYYAVAESIPLSVFVDNERTWVDFGGFLIDAMNENCQGIGIGCAIL